MCGIVGFVHEDSSRPCAPNVLERMRDLLTHRGPDDKGIHVDGSVALGHRRLSIIDLSGGHQPMPHESGRMWITFNGEIYNFMEVREELERQGHVFRTRSDTEVLLNAYAAYGPGCLSRLNGMFAFALWDSSTRTLFLARDRLGKKPLYWAEHQGTFLFASEIKALFAYDGFPREVNPDALQEYLTYNSVSGESTLYRGVRALPPGCYLVWEDGRISIRTYWDIELPPQTLDREEQSPVDALDALLQDAVSKRLISEVPLGTFNSGGVDSSLVTALVARQKAEPVHSFSVGFAEKDYDERPFADLLSRTYGTCHHEIVVGAKSFADALPAMIWHHDEPLHHPNSVLIYFVSRLAREYVTVVLTGEGADELYAGYPRYLVPRLSAMIRPVPLLSKILVALGSMMGDHRWSLLGRAASMSREDVLRFNSVLLRGGGGSEFLAPEWRRQTGDPRLELLARARGDDLSRLLYLDLKTYLVSILMRQDKMSMATSIESRVPFLDYRIVERAFATPPHLKHRGNTTKLLVKEVARKYLPEQIVNRRKSGFGVPLASWFADETALGRFLPLLGQARIPFFDQGALVSFLREGRHRPDYWEIVWNLVNLELWYRTCVLCEERVADPNSIQVALQS